MIWFCRFFCQNLFKQLKTASNNKRKYLYAVNAGLDFSTDKILFSFFVLVPDRIYPVERKIQSNILFLPSHCAYIVRGDQFSPTDVVETVTSEKNNSTFFGFHVQNGFLNLFCSIRIFLIFGCKNSRNFRRLYDFS